MENKFKVGDKVRVLCDKDSIVSKKVDTGKVGKIVGVHSISEYKYVLDIDERFSWRDSELEFVTNNQIVIRTDGYHITTATLYEDGEPVKIAQANCSPEDTFDFMVGANLAMTRLVEATKKPKYYNGKVVCVKTDYDLFTVGKVYEVKDGIIRRNDGTKYPRLDLEPYRDAEDVRHAGCRIREGGRHNSKNEFIPLVED